MTDNNDTECDVENCSYWVPEGMEYLMEDHERLHDIIKQAYMDGAEAAVWKTTDYQSVGVIEVVDGVVEEEFEFKEEYDWWDTDD